MKLAIVVGGWHWPLHFFLNMALEAEGADLFVIGHRSPELPIVREEKCAILSTATGRLADLDRILYAEFPTVADLRDLGWIYREEPNICGDWCFFNQWLEKHDWRQYDVILNCHDDTYLTEQTGLFGPNGMQASTDWLLLANGTYPQAPEAYVRGSFEFWKPELLDRLGGKIDLGTVTLTREGKTDSPPGIAAISAWNDTAIPLRRFMTQHGLSKRIAYLSPYYRVSRWAIEGERGFMHFMDGVPWSYEEGCKTYLS